MAASLAAPAIAQTWPAKQLHMVIPYPPGGPSDVSTRIVMDRAAQILGQSVLFDNKAGASGMIGAEYVKNQPVDTYTFLTTTTAMVCITRHLQPIPFDPEKDFIPVSRMSTSWGAFAVHPSVPAKTVAEFVAYAKANPGKINYGSAGLATITHLFGEMLNLEAGIQMVHVPYRGSAPATNALLAGEVQVQFDQLTLPHIKAGKVRGLAMLAEVRHPDFPDIPTLREQGYGKDGGDSWFGVLAPAGTPLAVVAKLDQAIATALRAPDIMAKVHNGGMRVTYLNPADFKERIAVENKSFGEIIKKGNIKLT
ncbi:MAG: tripartite tricarboxylate transporter substrate binding protein [Reyranella sp.]|nr:tripartite tricarboxylate transporter substrate binding protein [Reyranella sp.]